MNLKTHKYTPSTSQLKVYTTMLLQFYIPLYCNISVNLQVLKI